MSFDGDLRALFGKGVIEDADAILLEKLRAAGIDVDTGVSDLILSHLLDEGKPIGILGAGIGGLYTALMLESIGIKYEIIEVSDRVGGRILTHKFWGPNDTYDYYESGAMRFPLPKDGKNGVMARLVDLIKCEELNDLSHPPMLEGQLAPFYFKAAEGHNRHPAFSYFNGVRYFENEQGPEPSGFRAESMGVDAAYIKAGTGAIHTDVIKPFARMVIQDYEQKTKKGWAVLQENDSYSVRGYMASKYIPSTSLDLPPRHLPTDVINWCNLLERSSGGYDRALSDDVYEALAFAHHGVIDEQWGDVEWKTIKGGVETLPNKMYSYLKKKAVEDSKPDPVKFGQKVTTIERSYTYYLIPGEYSKQKIPSGWTTTDIPGTNVKKIVIHDDPDPPPAPAVPYWRLVRYPRLNITTVKSVTHLLIPSKYKDKEIPSGATRTKIGDGVFRVDIEGDDSPYRILVRVRATIKGTDDPKVYGHVISTIPLPVLRTLDIRHAGLHTVQSNALRALDYAPAIKIAILFEEAWWTTRLNISGGQTFTDLPIRTIVYPSYTNSSEEPSKVLIASYTGTSDASRLSALALHDREALKNLVLRNLAEVHEGVKGAEGATITLEELEDLFVDMHVKDWNSDQDAMGAFAYFSPGEFGRLYTSLTVPAADGCLHFAGEALSTRHAWIVGALDSAWRAVREFLVLTDQTAKLKAFEEKWRGNSEWIADSALVNGDLLDEHVKLLRTAMAAGVI